MAASISNGHIHDIEQKRPRDEGQKLAKTDIPHHLKLFIRPIYFSIQYRWHRIYIQRHVITTSQHASQRRHNL